MNTDCRLYAPLQRAKAKAIPNNLKDKVFKDKGKKAKKDKPHGRGAAKSGP